MACGFYGGWCQANPAHVYTRERDENFPLGEDDVFRPGERDGGQSILLSLSEWFSVSGRSLIDEGSNFLGKGTCLCTQGCDVTGPGSVNRKIVYEARLCKTASRRIPELPVFQYLCPLIVGAKKESRLALIFLARLVGLGGLGWPWLADLQ